MTRRSFSTVVMIFLVIFLGCSDSGKKTAEKPKDNVVRSYDKNKRLVSEVPMKDGKRHGLARTYYTNGKVNLEMPYVEDSREGTSKKYYESGLLYQETEYKEDQIHGKQRKYDVSGLIAEARFEFGHPCIGLDEYSNGKKRPGYPSIIIRPVDRLQVDGTYTLELSLTDGASTAKFYLGSLTDSGCLHGGLVPLPAGKNSISAYQRFALHPGQFLMEELNFVAEATTRMGNKFVAQKKFNLSIEN